MSRSNFYRDWMGKLVSVSARISPLGLQPLPEPRTGWVVGRRTLTRQGTDFYGQPVFVEGRATPVLLVTFWPTENAVKVPETAASLIANPPKTSAEWKDFNAGPQAPFPSSWGTLGKLDHYRSQCAGVADYRGKGGRFE